MNTKTLFHATTPKKAKMYRQSGRIIKPVRGFTTLQAAMAWAMKTGRSVILQIEGTDCHKLPDHHNAFGLLWEHEAVGSRPATETRIWVCSSTG